jgi:hypothetical protein
MQPQHIHLWGGSGDEGWDIIDDCLAGMTIPKPTQCHSDTVGHYPRGLLASDPCFLPQGECTRSQFVICWSQSCHKSA